MTGYVSTRYYRAPEIMLTWKRYNEKVDIWSAACIFAEMLLGEPLFLGKNHIDQFCVITQLLGSPPDHVISHVTSPNVSLHPWKIKGFLAAEDTHTSQTMSFVRSLPAHSHKPWTTLIPGANTKGTHPSSP